MSGKPYDSTCWRRTIGVGLIGLLLLSAFFLTSCNRVQTLRRKQQRLSDEIAAMNDRAQRCSPEKLALAEANVKFAGWELGEGNFMRAEKHLAYAEPLAEAADNESVAPYCLGDRDRDRIPDVDDKCPDDPENYNSFQDEDGCPEGDKDGDGIVDPADACPEEPEDFDGIADEDGCPVTEDKDNDGILDVNDRCPLDPEDLDGFEDKDGCPDEDNDKDKVCDPFVAERGEQEKYKQVCKGVDKCRDVAEDLDGVEDDDGCPEGRARIAGDRIEISEEVYFATNKTKVLPKSSPLLDDIATLLKANASIQVRIEGHTDDRGSARSNLKLSQGRADSVRKELVGRGIDGGRLQAVGYGEDRPKVPVKGLKRRKKKEARALNRRVEFVITSQ